MTTGFDHNDREAIMAALADHDKNNLIAQAMAERLKELLGRYWLHAEKLGRVPTELILVRPATAFDSIAYLIFLHAMANTVASSVPGKKLTIVWATDGPSDAQSSLE